MELKKGRYRITVAILSLVIALSFLTANLVFLSRERQAMTEELERDMSSQAALVTTFVRESLLRNDFEDVERFFLRWGAENDTMVEVTAVMDNGFTLAHYRHPDPPVKTGTIQRRVDYAADRHLDFTLTFGLTDLEAHLVDLRTDLLTASLVLTLLLGIGLWQVIKRLALLPLENEILGHRQTEKMLRKSEYLLNLHMENTPLGVMTWDRDFNCIQWNPAAEHIFGFSAKEAKGVRILEKIVPQGIKREIGQQMRDLLDANTGLRDTNENLTRDGRTILCEWYDTPLKDEQGNPIGIASVVRDITDQKSMEMALVENEQRFRSMIENAGDAIYIHDRFGHIYDVNQVASEQTGFGRDELIKMSVAQLDAGIDWNDLRDTWDLGEANPEEYPITLESAHRRKDGSVFPMEVRISLLPSEQHGHLYLAMVRDISERRRVEAELADNARELDFQKAAMDEHAIVSIANVDGRITYVNDRFCAISGYSREELMGQNHSIVSSGEHDREFYSTMWRTIIAGKTWHGTFKNRKKNGQPYWVDATIMPFLDASGKPFQYVAIRTDITDRIQATENAEEANRAKSEFLSSMSHELRTPLNAIVGFSQILEMETEHPLTDEQLESVRHIRHGGEHLLELINEILDLAKIESGKFTLSLEPVDPNEIIHPTISMVRELAKPNNIKVTVEENPAVAGLAVRVDRGRFRQVLLNLLSNAVKYNRVNGAVTLSKTRVGDAMRFSIADTGMGIPESLMEDLFQPFNRLNAEISKIEGTGIGLTITRRLVEAMDGKIGVTSVEGEGSTFWIEFKIVGPIQDEIAPAPALGTAPAGTDGQNGTVLYIEDNSANLILMNAVFKRLPNKTLITATDAESGLAMAESNPPDLILMDINLPGMSGIEALKRIQCSPSLSRVPVIAVSANAMDHDIEYARKAGFAGYITKPFKLEKVIQIVSDYFDDQAKTT